MIVDIYYKNGGKNAYENAALASSGAAVFDFFNCSQRFEFQVYG